jgi:hypothetical protein
MKGWLPLIFLLLIHSITLSASDKAKRDGKDLVEHAETKTNIFELPSFEMKASVRVDDKGKPLDGSYLLLWNGRDQWREEISLPGYSEVQVGGKGVVFLKRSTDSIPVQIEQLRLALGYGSNHAHSFIHAAPGPKETVKQVHDRKVNGLKVECAEIADQESGTREVCVDVSTGALVRQHPYLDRDVTPISTKLFPRFLSYIENGKSVAEVQVTELKTTEGLPSSAFEPPVGAVSKLGCMNPTPARLVHRGNPQYPEQERQSHAQGTVAMYAMIAKDGCVRGVNDC